MRADTGLPIAHAREDGSGGREGRPGKGASPRKTACRRLLRRWRRSLAAPAPEASSPPST